MRSTRALVIASVLAVVAAFAPDPPVVSAVVVLWFLCVVPGTVLCRLLDLETGTAFGWVSTIAGSFALDALVTQAMVYAGVWTPARGTLALALVVLGVIGAGIMARRARTTGADAA
jgi:hypothetical protein